MFRWLRRKPKLKPLSLGSMLVYASRTWDDNSRRLLSVTFKSGRLVADNGGDNVMIEVDGKSMPVSRDDLFRDHRQFQECLMAALNNPRKLEW